MAHILPEYWNLYCLGQVSYTLSRLCEYTGIGVTSWRHRPFRLTAL